MSPETENRSGIAGELVKSREITGLRSVSQERSRQKNAATGGELGEGNGWFGFCKMRGLRAQAPFSAKVTRLQACSC